MLRRSSRRRSRSASIAYRSTTTTGSHRRVPSPSSWTPRIEAADARSHRDDLFRASRPLPRLALPRLAKVFRKRKFFGISILLARWNFPSSIDVEVLQIAVVLFNTPCCGSILKFDEILHVSRMLRNVERGEKKLMNI